MSSWRGWWHSQTCPRLCEALWSPHPWRRSRLPSQRSPVLKQMPLVLPPAHSTAQAGEMRGTHTHVHTHRHTLGFSYTHAHTHGLPLTHTQTHTQPVPLTQVEKERQLGLPEAGLCLDGIAIRISPSFVVLLSSQHSPLPVTKFSFP